MPVLGTFALEAPLASGGMGAVWRGRHQPTGTPAAIKVLSPAAAGTPSLARALREEIRAVAALSHPHIVWVYDFGEIDAETAATGPLSEGSPWLAMELVAGGTLSRPPADLDWPGLRRILRQLLGALAHAHAHGVVHRDIKPGNALWSAEDRSVKLTDFGMAYALASPGRALRGGTPAYMAPEQFSGDHAELGPWTDLYALGCVAWALATGRRLFIQRGFEALRAAHTAGRLPGFAPRFEVPTGLEAWLRRLLAPRLEQRFRRAADATRGLEQLGAPRCIAHPAPSGAPASEDTTLELPSPPEATTRMLSVDAVLRPALSLPPASGAFPPHWRAVQRRPASVRLAGAGIALFGLRPVPLVGREAERDALWAQLGAVAADGRPRVAVLHGPAGCGKSRLGQWLAQRAHELGAATPMVAYHGRVAGPGTGVSALVAHALRVVGLSGDAVPRQVVRALARDGVSDPAEAAALVDVVRPPGRSLTRTQRRAVTVRFLRRRAARRPLVLWLDDVHWGADALELVTALLDAGSGAPVLAVLTARDEALVEQPAAARLLGALLERPGTLDLGVQPLRGGSRAELVRALLPLEPVLARRVDERTRGNPLFAVQLVSDWVARGLLLEGPSGYGVRPGADLALPDSIASVWGDRVQRVVEREPSWGPALQVAAALGGTVDHREWEAACELLGLEASQGLVDALRAERLVRSDPGHPGARWSFVHGMLRESVAQATAPEAWRARIHRACAGALRGLDDYGAVHVRVGRHLLAAGAPLEALQPLAVGMEFLAEDLDFEGLAALASEREHGLRMAGVPEADERWADQGLAACRVVVMRGSPDEALEATEALVARARRAGWRRTEAQALRQQSLASMRLGRLEEAVAQARASAEVAADLEPWLAAAAVREQGRALTLLGRLEEAEAALRGILPRVEHESRPGRAATWLALGDLYAVSGRTEEAVAALRTALDLASDLGRELQGAIENSLGEIARATGALDEARARYARATSLFSVVGSHTAVVPRLNLALVCVELGELGDARGQLGWCMEALGGHTRLLAACRAALLSCHLAAGDGAAFDADLAEVEESLARMGAVDPDVARMAALASARAEGLGQLERAERAAALARALYAELGDLAAAEAVGRLADPG